MADAIYPFCTNSEEERSLLASPDWRHVYADRYTDASATWVMVSSILIFFMKAGFLFVEDSFAETPQRRRRVIINKYLDTCASAIGFFFFGYAISGGYWGETMKENSDYIFFFFRFTFASNTATIIGGTLCGEKRTVRMLAVFMYAFLVSSVIHPVVAWAVWSRNGFMSAAKFCNGTLDEENGSLALVHVLSPNEPKNTMYILDYAGAGVVHLLGGIGGLVLSIAHKRAEKRRPRRTLTTRNEDASESLLRDGELSSLSSADIPEAPRQPSNFWVWMYPKWGGPEHIEYSALGVLILWTTWFAFNCGSTESMSSGKVLPEGYKLFHRTAGRIAINMILCAGAGGLTAIIITSLVQLKYHSNINANEVANGILSCLVAVTGGCAFIRGWWSPIIIGIVAVGFYHFGCWVEYKLSLPDTARVIPVHAFGGFWGLVSTGLFRDGTYIKGIFGSLCFCNSQDVPVHSVALQTAYQLVGALIIIAWSLITVGIIFWSLSLINVRWVIQAVMRLFCLNGCSGGHCQCCSGATVTTGEYGDCLLTEALSND